MKIWQFVTSNSSYSINFYHRQYLFRIQIGSKPITGLDTSGKVNKNIGDAPSHLYRLIKKE
jgi:hypothetical protein